MGSDSQGQLEAWVRGVTDVAISFDPPSSAPETGSGVGLYLLEMRGQLPLSPARPDIRQVDLGYLVTTWADEPEQAHDLLVDLCFAAMDQQGMEVELDPPEVQLWQALGVPPQPCFRVNVSLRRERLAPDTRPVLKPLVLESAAISAIRGVVQTPGKVAVPEARVEIPQLGRAATTDRKGSFLLDGVPNDARPLAIRVRARGREVTRELSARDDRSMVVITIDPTEAVHA
jgi:hypothetical protein